MEPIGREKLIVGVAERLAEAIRDAAYTRKSEDWKTVTAIQQELLALCPPSTNTPATNTSSSC